MPKTVQLGGAAVSEKAVPEAFARAGYRVVHDGDGGRLDVAVFVDAVHGAAGLVDASPGAWLDAAVTDVRAAFSFVRSVLPRLVDPAGGLVLATSLAADLGVPGRSLDAAVAGALGGLARSVLHEAPTAWVMLLTIGVPTPVDAHPSADVAWARASAGPRDPVSAIDAVVRAIECVSEPTPPRGGTFITYARGSTSS